MGYQLFSCSVLSQTVLSNPSSNPVQQNPTVGYTQEHANGASLEESLLTVQACSLTSSNIAMRFCWTRNCIPQSCDSQQKTKKLVSFCICLSCCKYMQICVNNELRGNSTSVKTLASSLFPPWELLKSDIVSLRFPSQSSVGLSIVGGTERELRLIDGGRRQVAHKMSGPAAVQA